MPKSRKFQDNLPKRGKREENMERIQKISRQLAANIKSAFQKKRTNIILNHQRENINEVG